MAYKDFSGGLSLDSGTHQEPSHTLHIDGQNVALPDESFVRDADLSRDGVDLILDGPHGHVVVEGYFAAEPTPNLVAPNGATLTPDLVNSFTHNSMQFAGNESASDVSAVGSVKEASGHATVTHADGTSETITIGTKIYEGDIIETDAHGAVNIVFIDETSFAVSDNARLAIDEYVFDPATQSGETNFSVLKGVFVFTSGLIGREDPDDVHIDTPVGSIGIRGTIIAGNVTTGEITVLEGAIVLRDFDGAEMTLASQFETAKFDLSGKGIEHMGHMSADALSHNFSAIVSVAPTLFSSVNDAAHEGQSDNGSSGSENHGDGSNSGDGHGDNGGPHNNAAPPPVAPPMTNGGGLGPNNGGLPTSPQGPAPGPQGPAGNNAGPGPGPVGGGGNNPPPPPPHGDNNIDPRLLMHDNNIAPAFHAYAPHEFFMSAEGQSWVYHFDQEFQDPDGSHAAMTFALGGQTITQLNGWLTSGILDVSQNGGWSFNSATGELELHFSSNLDPNFAAGTIKNLDILIQAFDSQGAASGWHTFGFDLYNAQMVASNGPSLSGGTVYTSNATGAAAWTFTTKSGSHLFLNNQNDTVTLSGNSDSIYVNLGGGTNTVYINGTSHDNTIVGGEQSDIIHINNNAANNKIYGMGGDDNFDISALNLNSITGLVLDGGHNNFLSPGGSSTGDVLAVSGAGNLDFRTIMANNQISGIEHLKLANSASNTVDISYDNVIQMTGQDGPRTLIFDIDATDNLTLHGDQFLNMTQGSDVTLNGTTYHSYTNASGDTFLFHSNGGVATVAIDGTNVDQTISV